jgi:hypothetical protein
VLFPYRCTIEVDSGTSASRFDHARSGELSPSNLNGRSGIVHRRLKPQQQRRKASQTARGFNGRFRPPWSRGAL